jgi:AP-3 complex subunit sigma
MIHAFLVINNTGKIRLAKWFIDQLVEAQQQACIREVYAQVSKRSDKVCNFIEHVSSDKTILPEGTKLIYRHYATLYFIAVVDSQESELGVLDLIQVK